MRALAALAVIAALLGGGCNREPGFDERYDRQSGDLEASANRMQADLANQLNAAAAAASHTNEGTGHE